jgi:hypothetical protein
MSATFSPGHRQVKTPAISGAAQPAKPSAAEESALKQDVSGHFASFFSQRMMPILDMDAPVRGCRVLWRRQVVSGPRLFVASKATAVPCVGWLGKKRSECLKVFGKLIVAGSWMTVHRGMTATQERTLGSAKATLFCGLEQVGEWAGQFRWGKKVRARSEGASATQRAATNAEARAYANNRDNLPLIETKKLRR